MKVKNYQELIVWQRAMDLVELVYKASRQFPREEFTRLPAKFEGRRYRFLPTIAEGQRRTTTSDFLRHLSIAYGSLCEVETQILIAGRLNYLTAAQVGAVMAPPR
jgi:four helix bundle protein